MKQYEFMSIYFNLKSEKSTSHSFTVEANTKWGSWTKAIYTAMEKETDENILVEIDLISDQEVTI